MTTDVQTYSNRLLLALREREVPGPRIAEALAEVQSHVAETGEDPQEAFGDPDAYAGELAAALTAGGAVLGERWAITWGRASAYGIGGFLAAGLSLQGVLGLALGESGALGFPALLSLLLGVAALAVGTRHLVRTAARDADRVLDPRTGTDMAPPFPRWAWAVMAAPAVLAVVLGVVIGLSAG